MIHIATSADLGRAVRRGLREAVLFSADNWLVGPCSSTPEVHPHLRCDHWGLQGRRRAHFLRSFHDIMKAIGSPGRIALWASRQASDTVASWAFCAWRLLRYPSQPNIDLVLLGSPAGAEDPVGLGSGFLRVTPADARRGLDQACSLSLTQVRGMARAWRKLSDRAPILAGGGADGVRKHKPLSALGTYQASFFPRLDAGQLLLSRFDELLFVCLADQGSTPADVFLARGAAGEELRRGWLAVTGDVFPSIRLAQWAAHRGADAALIREPHRADNVMLEARYRLSETGRAIGRDGLGKIERGAPLAVWGAVAYDPLAPWTAADGQRLEKVGGPRHARPR